MLKHTRRRNASSIAILMTLLSYGGVARADEADDLYDQGFALYEKGAYAEAEAKFEAALSLRAAPDTAAALGQSEEKQGKLDEAAQHYAHALAYFPASVSADKRARVASLFDGVKTQVARFTVTTASGATLLVDAQDRGRADADGKALVFVMPGRRTIEVRNRHAKASRTVDAVAGSDATVAMPLETSNGRDGRQPGQGRAPDPVIMGVGFGVAGAGTVVAAILGGLAISRSNEADDLLASTSSPEPCSRGGATCDEIFSLKEEERTLGNAAIWTIVGSGVALLGTTGYVLYMTLGSQPSNGTVRVLPTLAPGAAGLHVSSSF
jgi:tetratricopeptide (TPR) repeat protein